MIRENKIKRMLKEQKSVIGTFVKTNDPAVVEVLGLSGFDFVIIDNEHTAMNIESTVHLIRAANLTGMAPVVRVRENHPAEILQALDAGALGVQVPQVNTKDQAVQVVESVKYAPLGKRGYAASQRSAMYGFMNPAEYAERSNEETLISCYCETAEAIRNLDQILQVEQIDVIFIGPYDLSQALGVLGQTDHPLVLKAIDEITEKVRAANKAVGIIASDAGQAEHWIQKGIHYISLSSDLGMISALGKQYLRHLRK